MKYLILAIFMVFTMSEGFDINTDRAAVRAILDSNGLQSVPIGDFSHEGSLGRIIHIYHDGNWIWSTPKKYAKLTKIPAEIGNLTELQEIDLLNNSITSISDSIRNCKNLQRFDVSNNLLDSLPKLNFRSIAAFYFKVYHNKLQKVSDSICNLRQLTWDTLRLNDNLLRSLPSSIGNLKSLVSIYAQNNLLDSIPSSIGSLPNLHWLQMDYNNITYLPKTIGDTGKCIIVWADHNKINSIPVEMINSHVGALYLDYNCICARNSAYNWFTSSNFNLDGCGAILYADNQNCTRIESQPSSPLEPFSIYPNPFCGTTFIKTEGLTKIFDLSGRLVLQTSKNTVFNALPGVYILKSNGNIKKVVSIR